MVDFLLFFFCLYVQFYICCSCQNLLTWPSWHMQCSLHSLRRISSFSHSCLKFFLLKIENDTNKNSLQINLFLQNKTTRKSLNCMCVHAFISNLKSTLVEWERNRWDEMFSYTFTYCELKWLALSVENSLLKWKKKEARIDRWAFAHKLLLIELQTI